MNVAITTSQTESRLSVVADILKEGRKAAAIQADVGLPADVVRPVHTLR